jgi:hypothetical protein
VDAAFTKREISGLGKTYLGCAWLRNCATTQHHFEEETESTKFESALITCRISRGCFSRYRARIFLSLSYRTTSARRKTASVWLTRDKLRPTARAIALGLISPFSSNNRVRTGAPRGSGFRIDLFAPDKQRPHEFLRQRSDVFARRLEVGRWPFQIPEFRFQIRKT